MKLEHSNLNGEPAYAMNLFNVARQMFYCAGGQHRFSETGYSQLFCKHGNFKEYEQAAKMSCLGFSTDGIADVLSKDPRTIATWQRSISKKANIFHESIYLMATLVTFFLQMDELWSYLGSKKTASDNSLIINKLH